MYRKMNEKEFMHYAIDLYDAQEKDPRFKNADKIIINLPGGLDNFIVKKYVYSPEHINVAFAWPEYIAQRIKNKSFLEIGTRTGVAAIYVALNGNPSQVVATDISPYAIENCLENAAQYGLSEPFFKIRVGDVFDPIAYSREKYHVIFWNFPWNASDMTIPEILIKRGEKVTPEKICQLMAGLDSKYNGLQRLIQEAHLYLNEDGEILLGASEKVRHDIIYDQAHKNGYTLEIADQKEMVIDPIVKKIKSNVVFPYLKP